MPNAQSGGVEICTFCRIAGTAVVYEDVVERLVHPSDQIPDPHPVHPLVGSLAAGIPEGYDAGVVVAQVPHDHPHGVLDGSRARAFRPLAGHGLLVAQLVGALFVRDLADPRQMALHSIRIRLIILTALRLGFKRYKRGVQKDFLHKMVLEGAAWPLPAERRGRRRALHRPQWTASGRE